MFKTTSSAKPRKLHHELGNARRYAIMASLVLSQLVQMVPYGAGINSSYVIAAQLGGTELEASWIAASYPYVLPSFSRAAIATGLL